MIEGGRTASARQFVSRLCALFLLGFVIVGVVRTMDTLALQPATEPRESAAPLAAESRQALHAGNGRLFVLMLDSLRYATATDPARMPYLVSMRARSTYGRTLSSRDAVTVSALRAAFTGRDGFSVLGFVKNFWRGDAQIDSLFAQAHRAGMKTAIYSDGSFDQFGPTVADYRDHEVGDGTERFMQDNAAEEALADFVSGAHDIVVCHVTYTDHVAHAYGVGTEPYELTYTGADALVAKLDRAISEDDTFLVMGDHGHDLDGRHALGLDIPTYTNYRGPGFRAGHDLGTISITEHRYLASWALGLPIGASYSGGRHPDALLPIGAAPPGYRAAFDPLTRGADVAGTMLPRGERIAFVSIMAYLGLLGAIWWFWLGERLTAMGTSWPFRALACVAALPIGFPSARPYGYWVGSALAIAWLMAAPIAPSIGRRIAAAATSVIASTAIAAWGYLLAVHRVEIHEPLITTLETLWELGAVGCAALAMIFGGMNLAWVTLAVSALLFYPTVYRYGAPGSMAFIWCFWVLFLALNHLQTQWHLRRNGPALPRILDVVRNLLPAVPIAFLLIPFSFSTGDNFRFTGWDGEFTLEGRREWFVYALVAKVIVFVRFRRGGYALLAGAAAVALFTAAEAGVIRFSTRPGGVIALGLLLVALGATRFRLGARGDAARVRWTELARVAWLSALYGGYFYLIRVSLEVRQTADLLFAALTLSAAFIARLPDRRSVRQSQAFLLLVGLLVAGWITLAWTTHRLEWGFLYDWIPAVEVERHVGLLSPLLLCRYAIPVLIVRLVVAERFADPIPAREALRLAGVKILGLAALLAGIGYVSALTNVYLEAVEECAIFFLLMTGLAPSLFAGGTGTRVVTPAGP